jgi:hypothetical protein
VSRARSFSSRKFPHLGWAWPTGQRDQLIVAAICPDDERALTAIRTWLNETNLDDATFAEHRLLAAITTRFDERLAGHPEYPRLCGLQRLNWTKSRMAIAAAKPALEKMVALGLRPILMKGACRVALDSSEQKSRTSYDLDLLLSPEDFVGAFEVLADGGWKSTRGESTLGLRARISSVRARNLKQGRFGDIDLHQSAYHFSNQNSECDQRLFETALPVTFHDLALRVPVPEERLAMAIGHGGWDGHNHSDWLVDAARIIEPGTVDWNLFNEIVKARRLNGAAAIALSYLHHQIGISIPQKVRDAICGKTSIASPSQIASMFLAKEADSLSLAQRLVREGVESFHKLRHSGRDNAVDTPVFRAFTKVFRDAPVRAIALSHQVDVFEKAQAGTWEFSVTLEIPAPNKRRRVEFELNGPTRNICHLQAFHVRTSGQGAQIRFHGRVELQESDFPLVISALPGKLLDVAEHTAAVDKYGALPFARIAVEVNAVA